MKEKAGKTEFRGKNIPSDYHHDFALQCICSLPKSATLFCKIVIFLPYDGALGRGRLNSAREFCLIGSRMEQVQSSSTFLANV